MSDGINNKIINDLPNVISGDTSMWVAKLKKALMSFGVSVADNASTAANVDQVTELTLQEVMDYSGATVSRDILVSFNKDGVKKYKEARVWGRNAATANFSLLGTTSTNSYTFKDVESGTTYYIKVVAVDRNDNVSDFGTAPTKSITTSTSINNPSPPTQLTLTFERGVPTWRWIGSSTPDVTMYDLRTDQDPDHRIAGRIALVFAVSGQTVYETHEFPTGMQSGTAYLYAYANGLWSAPLVKTFTVPGLPKPRPPKFETTDSGFLVLMDDFGEGALNATVEVVSEYGSDTYTARSNTFQVFGVSGLYKVRYRFNSAAVAGEWSDVSEFMLSLTPPIEELDGSKIINGTISDLKIADGAVTALKTDIAAINSSTGGLNASTVSTAQLVANAVTAAKMAIPAINSSTGNLNDSTVGTSQLMANSVTSAIIASEAVGTNQLAANSVTAEIIAANAVGTNQLAANSVTSEIIAANAVVAGKIGAGAVTAEEIAANAVTAAKIAANAVTAAKIAANTITSAQIAANTITANNIKGDELTITGGTGDKVKIANGAITGAKLVANTVTSSQINADSIWGAVVNAGKLSAAKITADNIAANTITGDKMNVTALSAITATIGTLRTATTGARVEIKDNLIEVYDNNNVLRVRMGVWNE